MYLLAQGQTKYISDAPPDSKDPSHAAWEKEDTQIRIRMWNSMDSLIGRSLVCLDMAKQV